MKKPKSLRGSVQDYYKGQVKDVKNSFGLYLKGEPEAIAKKRTIRDNPKAIKKLKEQRKKEYASKTAADKTTGDPRGVNRKKAGGAMKKKGYSKGGKLKMVEKNGKKVPFFAADGKGKMAGGGMMKKKGYAKGGSVKVKSGDTLSQIAKSKGVTLKALLKANPGIKNANMIKVGQNIKVPTGQGKSIGPAGRSSNPYKGLTKNQMAALGQKKDNAFGSAKQRQRAATSSIRNTDAEGRASGSAKIMTTKSAKPTVKRGDRRNAAAKKAPPKKTAPKPTAKPGFGARLLDAIKPNRPGSAKMAGGGMMKKKGMKKGGVMKSKGMKRGGAMKRSKGGTVRGAGAATRGKRFGRSA